MGLAGFAEKSGSAGVDHTGYGGFAFWARLTLFTIDGQFNRIISFSTIGIKKVAKSGSPCQNTIFKGGANVGKEPVPFCKGNSSCFSFGVNP